MSLILLKAFWVSNKTVLILRVKNRVSIKIKNLNYNVHDFKFKKLRKNVDSMNFIIGVCMLCNCTVLTQIGYFDENFFLYLENDDFCKRLQLINENIFVVPKSKIYHLGGQAVDPKYKKEIDIRGINRFEKTIICFVSCTSFIILSKSIFC